MRCLFFSFLFFAGLAYAESNNSTHQKAYQCELTIEKEISGLWARVDFKNNLELPIELYLNSYMGKDEIEDTVFDVIDVTGNGLHIGHRGPGLHSSRPWGSHLTFVQPGKRVSFKINLKRFYSINKGVYKVQYVSFFFLPGGRGEPHEVRSNSSTVDIKN